MSERPDHEALVRFAGQCERVFRLSSPRAPGAVFVGAEIAPRAFDLTGYSPTTVSLAGKGLTYDAAFCGCIGEGVEYLSALAWGDEPLVELSIDEGLARLTPRDRAWVLGELSREEGRAHERRHFMPAKPLAGGGAAHLPMELCLRLPDTGQLPGRNPPSSSGCAAAPSLEGAVLAGLLEVIERDAAALWWYGGRPPGAVDPTSEARTKDLVGRLRAGALVERTMKFLDLTTELGIPVVAAVSAAPDGSAVACGLSAGLDLDVALERAALEACQMELAQDLVLLKRDQRGKEGLTHGDRAILRRMTEHNLLDDRHFATLGAGRARRLPAVDSATEALSLCGRLLAQGGYAAYWVDLSREKLSVPACRVVVPGLQALPFRTVSQRLEETAAAAKLSAADINSRVPLL